MGELLLHVGVGGCVFVQVCVCMRAQVAKYYTLSCNNAALSQHA